jgi:hypothetical protein
MNMLGVPKYTVNRMALGQCTADRAHPTVRTLGSYGPILHPALKAIPLAKGTALEL